MSWFPSIAALRAAQESGELTSVDIVRAHLEAQEASVLNAVVSVDADAALAAAASVDRRRAAGERLGPLAGVPVTVKDAFAVRGLPSSDGRVESRVWPDADAPAVARWRASDAIFVGKTNLATLLADLQSDNPLYGRTLHPWSAEHTPGGSSGGSAAAVSAGLSVLDLASDLAGSIRLPASWTGTFAHVPTWGVVSKRGHLPWPLDARLDPPLSYAGPIGRSVADVRAGVLAAAGPADPESPWRVDLPPARVTTLTGLRVGVWLSPDAPVDEDTVEVIDALAGRLRDAGCVVSRFAPPIPSAELLAVFGRVFLDEISFSMDPGVWGAAAQAEAGLAAAERGLSRSHRFAQADADLIQRMRVAWDAGFGDVDVVLAPTTWSSAQRHSPESPETRTIEWNGVGYGAVELLGRWSRIVNPLGAPCTVLPAGVGRRSALPVGAQLIGPRFRDLDTLRVAELMERDGVVGFIAPPVG